MRGARLTHLLALWHLSLLTVTTALVDVREFGASGNGATDDTAAVQAAIDNATLCGGGIVWFPTGRYNLSQIHVGGQCAYTLALATTATLPPVITSSCEARAARPS